MCDDVRVWGVSLLSDPTEVTFYRRGGHPAELSSLVKELNRTSTTVKRPVLVAAVGLRHTVQFGGAEAATNTKQCDASDTGSKCLPLSNANVDSDAFVPYLIVYDVKLDTQVSAASEKNSLKSDDSTKSTSTDNASRPQPSSQKSVVAQNKQSFFNDVVRSIKKGSGTATEMNRRRTGGVSFGKVKTKDDTSGSDCGSSDKKVEAPNCIQCIPIYSKCNSIRLGVNIKFLQPSTCGRFLIVCLAKRKDSECKKSTNTNSGDIKSTSDTPCDCARSEENHNVSHETTERENLGQITDQSGALDDCPVTDSEPDGDLIIVYSINNTDGACVTLNELPYVTLNTNEPSTMPTNVIAIPSNVSASDYFVS